MKIVKARINYGDEIDVSDFIILEDTDPILNHIKIMKNNSEFLQYWTGKFYYNFSPTFSVGEKYWEDMDKNWFYGIFYSIEDITKEEAEVINKYLGFLDTSNFTAFTDYEVEIYLMDAVDIMNTKNMYYVDEEVEEGDGYTKIIKAEYVNDTIYIYDENGKIFDLKEVKLYAKV